jgi:hypothetical protein
MNYIYCKVTNTIDGSWKEKRNKNSVFVFSQKFREHQMKRKYYAFMIVYFHNPFILAMNKIMFKKT